MQKSQSRKIILGKNIPYSEFWKEIMRQWFSVMDEFQIRAKKRDNWIKNQGGDFAYWYQAEVTNLGFLAGAIWRSKGVVLQEFGVTRKLGKGEADLWFKLGALECHIEAKGTSAAASMNTAIKEKLNDAQRQFEIHRDEKAKNSMTLCFAAPAVKKGDLSSFRWDEKLRTFYQPQFIVAYYSPKVRDYPSYEGYYYPGIALVGELLLK